MFRGLGSGRANSAQATTAIKAIMSNQNKLKQPCAHRIQRPRHRPERILIDASEHP